MTGDINVKCLDFLIFVCFSPFRVAIKWSLSASYTLRSVLQWGLNIISCVWNIALLYYYVTEGKLRQALLNVVTSWDLANLPVVFPSTEVLRSVSFVESSESYNSQDISLSGVIFEWSMLHDASSFNYSWEGLGAVILGTAAFCSYLLTFMTSERAVVVLEKGGQLWGWWWCHLRPLCCLAPLWKLNVAWAPCVLC